MRARRMRRKDLICRAKSALVEIRKHLDAQVDPQSGKARHVALLLDELS